MTLTCLSNLPHRIPYPPLARPSSCLCSQGNPLARTRFCSLVSSFVRRFRDLLSSILSFARSPTSLWYGTLALHSFKAYLHSFDSHLPWLGTRSCSSLHSFALVVLRSFGLRLELVVAWSLSPTERNFVHRRKRTLRTGAIHGGIGRNWGLIVQDSEAFEQVHQGIGERRKRRED